MNKLVVSLSCLLFATHSYGQKHEYFILPNGKRLTAMQTDSLMQASDQFNRDMGQGHLTTTMEVTWQYQSGDTLYKKVRFGARNLEAELQRKALLGKPLPSFALQDLQGAAVSLESLKGTPTVINLWFTACAPCVAEIPGLNEMKAALPDIRFLAMTYNSKAEVQAFLAKKPFSFQHVTDAKVYVDPLQIGYPTTLFVDKTGVIREVIIGAGNKGLNEAAFKAGILKIR